MPDNDNDRSPFGRRPNADPGGGSGAPKPRFAPWLVVPIILVALLLFNSVLSRTNTNKISFSEFQTAVADGKIVSDNDQPGAHLRQPGVGQDLQRTKAPRTSRHRCRPTCW